MPLQNSLNHFDFEVKNLSTIAFTADEALVVVVLAKDDAVYWNCE